MHKLLNTSMHQEGHVSNHLDWTYAASATYVAIILQVWHVKGNTDPSCLDTCCLYCGIRKLYYTCSFLPIIISRLMQLLGIIYTGFQRKMQGIRNDDQSLSPVTPLVSSTSSVVPNPLKCSGTIFNLLVSWIFFNALACDTRVIMLEITLDMT